MMESRFHIRPAVEVDAVAIARIYNHYVCAGGATFDAVPWTAEQTLAHLKIVDPEIWLIATDDTEVVGWASARRFSLRFGYRFSLETAIYVAPDVVGRGAADRLQRRIEDHCRAANVHHVMAKIVADNNRSMAFHFRHGYEIVGVQKEVGHMRGSWADVAILQKILASD